MLRPTWILLALVGIASGSVFVASTIAQEKNAYTPKIAPASEEAERAMTGFRLPEGVSVSLFAAEPMLANPVAFCLDEQGRVFVAETFRQGKGGVTDNRDNMHWLHDDLQARTVEDRLAFFNKHMKERVEQYGKEHDRIRLLADQDGDGKADQATVFADGFNEIVDGTGAGLLARRGTVLYTCIPKLWSLKDANGDGVADERKALHHGYGVRVAFRGHDLHGLTLGPDGRVYFSMADRGFNIQFEGKHFEHPECGGVFRCNLDGSELELIAIGLRNPQELAFDDYGNLFTCDNNSDSGDKARWTYIVEGADIGWRMYYQYLPDRGPWNREKLWHPAHDGQAAYIVPPIVNLADGPSGLVHYPGVGLPDRYADHFFLADFRGGPGGSGVRSFAVKPKGASFELVDSHHFLQNILATDVDFGFDGSMYVSDWVNGWNGEGKGRLYRFTHTEAAKNPAIADAAKIMREGAWKRSPEEMAQLLSHADRRVRLEAQIALAERGLEKPLSAAATSANLPLKARLHAIWGLGILARKDIVADNVAPMIAAAKATLIGLLSDPDAEIRAQAARTLGDSSDNLAIGLKAAEAPLLKLLKDDSPRVRAFAAQAIGRLTPPRSTGNDATARALIDALVGDATQLEKSADPVLRHSLAVALARTLDRAAFDVAFRSASLVPSLRVGTQAGAAQPRVQPDAASSTDSRQSLSPLRSQAEPGNEWATSLSSHPSAAVRLGGVLALRHLRDPEIARFLNDTDPRIVLEAARAIHDLPIEAAMPQLAALGDRKLSASPEVQDALLRRVLSANFRSGDEAAAKRVARIAADAQAPDKVRIEALEELKQWDSPPPLDRVLGDWRPIEKRDAKSVADAVRTVLGGLFTGSDAVRKTAGEVAAKYGIKEVEPVLADVFKDEKQTGDARASALNALVGLKSAQATSLSEQALKDKEPLVRIEGRRSLAKLKPADQLMLAELALEGGDIIEKQAALADLAGHKDVEASNIIGTWLDRLLSGDLPKEIQLDVLEAAKKRRSLLSKVATFEKSLKADDPLASYRVALAGGNAERGREIFLTRSEVSCVRCHQVAGVGGAVGPDLSKVAKEKAREYLLESLVVPNAQIAKGFETLIVETTEGRVFSGIVKESGEQQLKLMLADGNLVTIKKADIEETAKGQSSMPADLIKKLSHSDVRDLVEFLSSLK